LVEKNQDNEVSQEQRVKELETIRKRLAELERSQKLGLVWRDIPEDVETLLRDEMPVLMQEPDLDIPGKIPSDQSHILIEGDNLHALHVLQATHRNAIDVIYIDPPYNTGKEFVYNDKLIDAENTWRHSAWLSFMEKRLKLACALLKPSGIVFISIDNHEHSRLRLLGEQIFGESNLIGDLTIVSNLRGRSDSTHFATAHEYLLVFAKDHRLANITGFELSKEVEQTYKMSDSRGRFKPETLRKRGSDSLREDVPTLFYPIYWNQKTNTISLSKSSKSDIEITPKLADGRDGRWRWSKDKVLKEGNTELLVLETKGIPTVYVKMRLEGTDGALRTAKPKSFWLDPKYDSSAGTRLIKQMITGEFDNPKPLEYIKDVLRISTSASSIVLDFFAGSGTTLHAVAELNATDGGTRQCILVTNNENSICRDVTQPRLKAMLTGKWADRQIHDPLPGSLSFYQTGFIKRLKSPDQMRTEIAKHTIDLIAIKEGTGTTVARTADLTVLYGLNKTIAVVPSLDPDHVKLCVNAEKKVRVGDHKTVYLFTWSNQGVEDEIAALWSGWVVQPLPSEMLAALRRNAPAPRLFDVDGGTQ
jgi:adenine-specific DNA-methyltransferase